MAFITLVEWIHVSDLEDADPAQARQLVRQAREALADDDPRVEALGALENMLWEGTVPVEEMQQFASEWGEWAPEDGDSGEQPAAAEKGEVLPFLTEGLAFKTLVEWLHVSNLEDVEPKRARELIQDARQDLDEEDPRDADLGVIEELLWGGSMPVAELEAFSRAWGVWKGEGRPAVPPGIALDTEFRELAARLPVADWHTHFYDEALGAADQAEAGDQAGFQATVEKMRARLVEAWVPYVETPVLDAEVTAETVVGHRLLQDGIEGWLHALDQLERAENGEMSYDEALATAENANRLLIATQRLARRVHEEARE